MGIFSRFTDIINSNINALLDKAEDPEKMVRLIIQEMEDTLVEVRSASAKTIANKKDVVHQIARFQQESADWEAKAELAINKGREDLARSALQERQKASEAAASLEHELELIDNELSKLQTETSQLQEKLADAKNRQKTIIMRQNTVSSRLEVKKRLDANTVDDAMVRFDQFERKIDDLESQVEAYDVGKRSLKDEFANLEADSKIEDELAALKQKMQAGKAKPNVSEVKKSSKKA